MQNESGSQLPDPGSVLAVGDSIVFLADKEVAVRSAVLGHAFLDGHRVRAVSWGLEATDEEAVYAVA